jgi:hypothetical protein
MRKVRGVLGTGALWGVAGALFGALVGGLSTLLGGPLFGSLLVGGLWFGSSGFVLGSGFAVMLTVLHGRRSLDDLTPTRAAGWGALVGAGLPLLGTVLLMVSAGLPLMPVLVPIMVVDSLFYGALGAALATGTVVAAKRVPESSVGSGAALNELEPPRAVDT